MSGFVSLSLVQGAAQEARYGFAAFAGIDWEDREHAVCILPAGGGLRHGPRQIHDAQVVQQLSGVAPVTKSSGKTKFVHRRWACSKFLRQTFHEFATCSVRRSVWARAYFQMRRVQGHRYLEILRGLAFKWQRILYHCWKNREPYDQRRYLQRLRATSSPLAHALEAIAPS